MRIKYVGPCGDGVEIAATGQVVAKGEVVDVSDELGAGLLEQPENWQPASPAKATTPVVEKGDLS